MTNPLMLETVDFYRPWCRYCGAKEGPCVFADEDMEWVEDEDDFGFPICLSCVARSERRNMDLDCDLCYPESHVDCQSTPYNGAAGQREGGKHRRCSRHRLVLVR